MLCCSRALLIAVVFFPSGALRAADLGVGATREEVVTQLGAPKSKLNAGSREILSYPQGRVILEDGRVVSLDFKTPPPAVKTPPPLPPSIDPLPITPASTTTPEVKAVAAPAAKEPWFTDFSAAQAEATATHRRLLVLFTGSDWCPPCMEFEAKVAHAADFLNVTRPAFVLVKLDYPRNTPQPAALAARNEELRRRYSVSSYPSLLVITADGTKSTRVETGISRRADDIVDYYVQAVDDARRGKQKSSFWPW